MSKADQIPLHLEEDYQYFSALWEYKSKKNYHTSEKWDDRAKDWKIELTNNESFQQSNRERVEATVAYLQQQSVLNNTDIIIDIGCGPGRFSVAFAEHVKTVYASDISEKMLELAREHAQASHISNINYVCCDFTTLDIQKSDWEKKFDFVFTSITPAIGTIEGIQKINQMSRGYVFNSSFVHQSDSIEQQIANEVFQIDTPPKRAHSHWYYALLNLLWLQGYFPMTSYYKQNRTECLDYNDMLTHYYTRLFAIDIPQKQEKIDAFLQKNCNQDNKIIRHTQHHYGWLLWNVNDCVKRI